MTATPSFAGAINGATGSWDQDNALFLKVFAGMTIEAFANQTVTFDKHVVRSIASGKSAQFPRSGRAGAKYHTPGQELTGETFNHAEMLISLNNLLLSDVFIDSLDEAKAHYDVRSIYATEMGIALANQWDKHVLQTMIQAALVSTSPVTGEDFTGNVIENASAATDADAFVDSVFEVQEAMDTKNVPEEGRFLYVKPTQYYKLANSSKVQNVDFGNAGNGSTASGKVMMVAGLPVVKTNNLPQSNVTAGVEAGTETRQAVDARNVVAAIAHTSAVGTLKIKDLATESQYDIRRQGTLLVSKYAVGHGVLRPEGAGIIRTATP